MDQVPGEVDPQIQVHRSGLGLSSTCPLVIVSLGCITYRFCGPRTLKGRPVCFVPPRCLGLPVPVKEQEDRAGASLPPAACRLPSMWPQDLGGPRQASLPCPVAKPGSWRSQVLEGEGETEMMDSVGFPPAILLRGHFPVDRRGQTLAPGLGVSAEGVGEEHGGAV